MKGRGIGNRSGNSGKPLCVAPTQSNVMCFPEPFLAFYDRELENCIICLSKHIHYCNIIKEVFVLFCFSGKSFRAQAL